VLPSRDHCYRAATIVTEPRPLGSGSYRVPRPPLSHARQQAIWLMVTIPRRQNTSYGDAPRPRPHLRENRLVLNTVPFFWGLFSSRDHKSPAPFGLAYLRPRVAAGLSLRRPRLAPRRVSVSPSFGTPSSKKAQILFVLRLRYALARASRNRSPLKSSNPLVFVF
jgi:hypothetical protein